MAKDKIENNQGYDKTKIVLAVIFAIVILVAIAIIGNLQRYNYEMEGSCNSGKIGIDFSERFVFNESNPRKPLISSNPQKLNINGIDGINCNFKVKGELPYYIISNLYQDSK